jgi:hypothetical protein
MNLAYVAGIFDGEGCVNFARLRRGLFVRVMVVNTNLELLKDLQAQFGGDISKLKHKPGWKQGFSWRLCWSSAINFLNVIQPWLRVKHRQAETAFAWDAVRLGKGHATALKREEYLDSCSLLFDQLRWLNKKGSHRDPEPIAEFL